MDDESYEDLYKIKMQEIKKYRNNSTLVDLHIHTTSSDGEYTLEEILKMAKEKNYNTIAITDHDALFKYDIKTLEMQDYINIIKGIELSAKIDKGTLHILGYDYNNTKELINTTNTMRLKSMYNVLKIITRLEKDYDIKLNIKDIQKIINYKGNLGRPNIAHSLLNNKYVNSFQEAFDKFLIPAYKKEELNNNNPSAKECIELIKNANGIPVLAHPKTLKMQYKELYNFIKILKIYGLMGIEVFHSDHSLEDINTYLNISKELNLLISGGTDYHGPNTKPHIEFNSNLKEDDLTLIEYIRKRKQKID